MSSAFVNDVSCTGDSCNGHINVTKYQTSIKFWHGTCNKKSCNMVGNNFEIKYFFPKETSKKLSSKNADSQHRTRNLVRYCQLN